MYKLLQISTYGIKNLENKVTLNFANSTIEKGPKKINKVKAIYGYNGAGKSALVEAVHFYQQIALFPAFLLRNDTKEKLGKLINYKTKEFYVSIVFSSSDSQIIKHEILVKIDEYRKDFYIAEEVLSLCTGRTLNDKFQVLIENKEKKIDSAAKFSKFIPEYLNPESLRYSSICALVCENVNKKASEEVSEFEDLIFKFALAALNVNVYLSDADKHKNFCLTKDFFKGMVSVIDKIEKSDSWIDIYSDETIVPQDGYDDYEKENAKLERFIKLFKPAVIGIELKPIWDGKNYHVRRIFKYDGYEVDMEFESSGIKRLVKLFPCLQACAQGDIAFIDEIDTNINSVYLEKLVSFFQEYGEGQLVFTTHNLDTMNVLKRIPRAIVVIGEEGAANTWVRVGNRTPKKDYYDGYFPDSPMNIEDFDFLSVFLGD